jgi:hypothetical protein
MMSKIYLLAIIKSLLHCSISLLKNVFVACLSKSKENDMQENESFVSLLSVDTFATAVPDPIAIPISAFFRAGASLTPSPVIATLHAKMNIEISTLEWIIEYCANRVDQ